MSKNMMKRSLTLGALMAFVITGSAMAADTDTAQLNDFTTKVDKTVEVLQDKVAVKQNHECGVNSVENDVNIRYVVNIGNENGKDDNGDDHSTKALGQGAQTGGKDLTFNKDVTIYHESDSVRNVTGNASIFGIDTYTGVWNFNGSTDVTVKSTDDQNTGSAISATGIRTWGLTWDANQKKYVDGSSQIILNGDTTVYVSSVDASKGTNPTNSKNPLYGKPGTVTGIGVDENANVTAKKLDVTVESLGGDANKVGATAYGVNVEAGTANFNGETKITSTSKHGNAYGVRVDGEGFTMTTGKFEGNAQVAFDKDLTITATGAFVARGLEARNGSVVTVGNTDKTNNVNITAVATDEKASGDWVIGVFSRHNKSKIDIKGDTVTIKATATGDNLASGILANTETTAGVAKIDIDANNIVITADAAKDGNAAAITTMSGSEINIKGNLIATADKVIYTRGNAKTVINASGKDTVVLNGDIAFAKGYTDKDIIDAEVEITLNNAESEFNGAIYTQSINGERNTFVGEITTGTTLGLSNGATWTVTDDSFVNNLNLSDGNIKHNVGDVTVNKISGSGNVAFAEDSGHLHIDAGAGSLNLTMAEKTADDYNDAAGLTKVAERLGVKDEAITAKVVMAEGDIKGETTGVVKFINPNENVKRDDVVDAEIEVPANNDRSATAEGDVNDNADNYWHGVVEEVTEKVNTKNQAIGDAGISLKLHWRAHMNDMNKRMGELRNAEGEHGVWARMVRGESEYKNTKAQYNQYQLGYDEKLSVDKRWTVGAAVTFAEGDANYGQGSTDDKSTAFAIYGSKLNNDGTFVDLIARYAHLESDLDDVNSGKGDYATNGMSVSAEFGKRIQQGNGLWVEPQVELTYGTIDSAEFKFDSGKAVQVGDMDSLIGRVGFRIGKDLEQGNVYARASYLYDFDGETENAFSNATDSRTIAEDLGGGWWEVGVGANINLSKATYIYADVEKTFGGEVDTNWQWNLGVRYSF